MLGRRMAVWRGNDILREPGQGRSGARGQNVCGKAKNYAVRIGKRGGEASPERQDLGSRRAGQVRILGGRGAGTDLRQKVKA